ncbi:hypothetical protein CB0940_07170 [Cercospora beticola]|uniref:Uncharacterized protein n=1 Tax=Cercospora beticola TaxID=122368 RepID=A0A2G5H8A5_CERBT|nr:hypothetical protein CB0940_07170 [Cercospora beticola]PIA88543.1 hypothetical protein CB0940_07170 [Cercospora beticola]WPB03098.1 hypothetical protein RHO25_007735 [Cercospora beticola]
MDPSWYGGHNPYTQARMRELKKRELELAEIPHQAERPPLRAYYTDQGPYGPSKANKPPFESGDVSRSTNSGVQDQDRTPVAGPSSSGRPALKSFYTDQGAYGPGYSTGLSKGDTIAKVSAGSSKKKLQPVPEEDEGSSGCGDDRRGRPDKGKGKQTGSSSSGKDAGSGSSSSSRQTSTDGDVPGDKGRPQLQTRRSRGWFF